jgi:hypothetical protein
LIIEGALAPYDADGMKPSAKQNMVRRGFNLRLMNNQAKAPFNNLVICYS